MRYANKTLDDVTSLSAGATASVKLPRDRFVRDILPYFTLKIKNGGAGSVDVTESEIISLIQRIRVVVNGNDTLVDVNGYRKFLMNYYEFNTKSYTNIPTSIGAGATETFNFELPLIFAINPAVEWDINAVIPAHLTSSFYVYFEIGDPADINADFTLESGSQVEVTVKELYCDDSERRQVMANLRKIYELEVSKSIDAIYSSYTYKVDLDVGHVIQKLGIFAYDSTPALSNSVISDFKIKQNSPIDVDLEKIKWIQSIAEDKRMYDMESIPTGLTIWDAEFKLGGLDTRGLKSGDVTFNANTSVSSGSVVLYHREIA